MVLERAAQFFASLDPRKSVERVNILIKWECSRASWVKLNVDGSVANNQLRAGSGEVLRDTNDWWLKEFDRFLGVANSLDTKTWALRDGLSQAQDLDITHLLVELDAKILFELV